MQKRIESLFSNLFYLLFSAQILSPFVAGRTLYLENVIAVLNPYFIFWVGRKIRSGDRVLPIACGLLLLGVTGAIDLMTKMAIFVVSVTYIFYSRERGQFYLFRYATISVLFAVAQFVLLFVHPAWALKIGPTNIAHSIWGSFATPSFTNFFAIFVIPRVSGLSREGGFFASFLVACILLYWLDRGSYARSKSLTLMLAVGLILSVSKMSLVLLPAYLLIKYAERWNKIPYLFVPVLFSLPFILFAEAHQQFLTSVNAGTFLQRLGGYGAIRDLTSSQLLFGTPGLRDVHSVLAADLSYMSQGRFDYFTGLPGYIFSHGLAGTLLALVILWILGVTPAGLFLLLGMTLNVDIATNQNFVTLTYFIIFAYFGVKRRNLLGAVVPQERTDDCAPSISGERGAYEVRAE